MRQLTDMIEARERSLSTASTESSAPSTPHSVISEVEFPVSGTSKKIKVVAAIFFAAAAVALIVVGTVGGLGIPAIAAGVAAAVGVMIAAYLAKRDRPEVEPEEPKFCPTSVVGKPEVEEYEDLSDRLEEIISNNDYLEVDGLEIHSAFKKDCDRNRSSLYVEGQSYGEKCGPNASQEEIVHDFVSVLKRTGRQKWSRPISAALCQNTAILLTSKTSDQYGGRLYAKATEPKGATYRLEFPNGLAARIQIDVQGEYSIFFDENMNQMQLDPHCEYKGRATIEIALDGTSRIETQISLVPLH